MEARRFDRDPMSVEEFLDWHQYQEERYELVQGTPVRMMTGARQDHNLATANVTVSLFAQLRGGGCRTTASDTAVRTLTGVRYPDVTVDCGPFDAQALAASAPVLVVEVSSPSTRATDMHEKLDEYRATPGLRYVIQIEPTVIDVTLHERAADDAAWAVRRHFYLSDVIRLPELNAELTLADIYAGLSPASRTPLHPVD